MTARQTKRTFPIVSGNGRAPVSFRDDELEALLVYRRAVRDSHEARRDERRVTNENRSRYALDTAYARTVAARQAEIEALAHLNASLIDEE